MTRRKPQKEFKTVAKTLATERSLHLRHMLQDTLTKVIAFYIHAVASAKYAN